MTVDADSRTDLSLSWWRPSNQRLEIARLRQRLATAEEAAARCAIMLREADHRIKNSLQIVSSLMSLQANQTGKLPSARDVLRTAASRVQSIARMHDALQLSQGDDYIDLGSILSEMCVSLQAMGGQSRSVKISVQAQSVLAPVAFAQPVVLAVNELVVNALRHAFHGEAGGEVTVSLCQEGGIVTITVADNGVGLSHPYVESDGYGMKLVEMMVRQIKGKLQVDGEDGARFTLSARMPEIAMVGGHLQNHANINQA